MVSAIHQHESTIGIHPSFFNLPLISHPNPMLYVGTEHQFWFPVSYSKSPLAIYFTYGNVYVSMLLSQIILLLSPSLCPKAFSLCLQSPLLPCRQVHQYHLPRFHIYAFIQQHCFHHRVSAKTFLRAQTVHVEYMKYSSKVKNPSLTDSPLLA